MQNDWSFPPSQITLIIYQLAVLLGIYYEGDKNGLWGFATFKCFIHLHRHYLLHFKSPGVSRVHYYYNIRRKTHHYFITMLWSLQSLGAALNTIDKWKLQVTEQGEQRVLDNCCAACYSPHTTCPMFVLQAQLCQLLVCVAPYQTDSGGADIRLSQPPRPGSFLSD